MCAKTFGLLVLLAARCVPHAFADDAKAWLNTRAIVTTRSPLKMLWRDSDVSVLFPVVTSHEAKDDYVYVMTAAGHFGWVEKDKLIPLAEAVELFDERIKASADDPDGYYRRALARLTNDDQDGAVKDFNEAIRLDSKEASYYVGRAMARMKMKDLEKAVADLAEGVRLEPNDPVARYMQGRVYSVQRKTKDAAAAYGEAVRILPNYLAALDARAFLWEAEGNLDKSLADHDELVRQEPEYSYRYLQRARVRTAKKDVDGALKDFDKAVELSPDRDEPVTYRGIHHYVQRKYTAAITDFTAAVKLNPKNSVALNNQAWILATCPDEKLRDGPKALAMAKSACESGGWKHPFSLVTLAAAYAEVGQFDDAVKWQEKALELVDDTKKAEFRACLELYRSHKPKRD